MECPSMVQDTHWLIASSLDMEVVSILTSLKIGPLQHQMVSLKVYNFVLQRVLMVSWCNIIFQYFVLGSNLFQAAVHEIGHSLGLSHSEVLESVMSPFFRGYNPDFRLHHDDIDGIQELYGKTNLYKHNNISIIVLWYQFSSIRTAMLVGLHLKIMSK